MIPLVAAVRVGPVLGRGVRLWIPVPLFLVWLLLLPFAVLLLPVYVITCRALHVHPFRALAALGRLLGALSPTDVEIEHGERSIRIHIP